MKDKETGRVSYYTSKNAVVYTQLMLCWNVPPKWKEVPDENVEHFLKLARYKKSKDIEAALNNLAGLWNFRSLWNGADRNRLSLQRILSRGVL